MWAWLQIGWVSWVSKRVRKIRKTTALCRMRNVNTTTSDCSCVLEGKSFDLHRWSCLLSSHFRWKRYYHRHGIFAGKEEKLKDENFHFSTLQISAFSLSLSFMSRGAECSPNWILFVVLLYCYSGGSSFNKSFTSPLYPDFAELSQLDRIFFKFFSLAGSNTHASSFTPQNSRAWAKAENKIC